MTKEQFEKVLKLNKQKEDYTRVLNEINNNSSEYCLAFGSGKHRDLSFSWRANEGIEDILDKHHKLIIKELKTSILEIDKQIEAL